MPNQPEPDLFKEVSGIALEGAESELETKLQKLKDHVDASFKKTVAKRHYALRSNFYMLVFSQSIYIYCVYGYMCVNIYIKKQS